jgi:putative transcriptional regulator
MSNTEYLEALGTKIRTLRKQKGLTQTQLAESLGAHHHQEIIRIEKGTVNSTINMLRGIAKELGVSVSELVDLKK